MNPRSFKECPACHSRHTATTTTDGGSGDDLGDHLRKSFRTLFRRQSKQTFAARQKARNPPFENRICKDCGTAFAPECSRWIGILLIIAGFAIVAALVKWITNPVGGAILLGMCIVLIVRGIIILFGKARKLTILGKGGVTGHLIQPPTAAASPPAQPQVSPAPTPPTIIPVTAVTDAPASPAPSFDAEIRALAALHSDGLISEDEFNAFDLSVD